MKEKKPTVFINDIRTHEALCKIIKTYLPKEFSKPLVGTWIPTWLLILAKCPKRAQEKKNLGRGPYDLINSVC